MLIITAVEAHLMEVDIITLSTAIIEQLLIAEIIAAETGCITTIPILEIALIFQTGNQLHLQTETVILQIETAIQLIEIAIQLIETAIQPIGIVIILTLLLEIIAKVSLAETIAIIIKTELIPLVKALKDPAILLVVITRIEAVVWVEARECPVEAEPECLAVVAEDKKQSRER
jgi:hypothetical protein